MRSATPKLLHPLCGRPMIAWPVAAAQEAGAAKVVVVDSPEQPLQAALNGTVTFAIQSQARGTADAVKAAAEHIDPNAPVVILAGDVPLITRRDPPRAVATHEHQGAAATMATAVLDDPSGYGRVIRAPDGTVERVVETKAPGDATELELHIREVNTGHLCVRRPGAARRAERGPWRQRPGRVLPPGRSPDPPGVTSAPSSPTNCRTRPRRSGSTTGSRWRASARSPSGGSTSGTCSPA